MTIRNIFDQLSRIRAFVSIPFRWKLVGIQIKTTEMKQRGEFSGKKKVLFETDISWTVKTRFFRNIKLKNV